MKFIKTQDGELLNLVHVKRIKTDGCHLIAIMADGECVTVCLFKKEEMADRALCELTNEIKKSCEIVDCLSKYLSPEE